MSPSGEQATFAKHEKLMGRWFGIANDHDSSDRVAHPARRIPASEQVLNVGRRLLTQPAQDVREVRQAEMTLIGRQLVEHRVLDWVRYVRQCGGELPLPDGVDGLKHGLGDPPGTRLWAPHELDDVWVNGTERTQWRLRAARVGHVLDGNDQ
jgi:hypothetical protein